MKIRRIPLTQGYVAIIDSQDYEKIKRYSWCVDKRPNGLCYANTTIGRRTVRMHELIFPDARPERDHKNGNGLDNRRSNLRPATHAQNLHNRGKKTNAINKGVTFQGRLKSRPWQARIGYIHLGYFASAEEAGAAFDKAALEQRGEFARTNGVDVAITPNHRYLVVSKKFIAKPTIRHPEARILQYVLSRGHIHSVSGYQAPKIGKQSHCKICSGKVK